MSDYITRLRIIDENGQPQDKQIDYTALANLPESLPANGGHAKSAELDSAGQKITETYATKTDLANEVAALVNSAPEALDTLNELAQALGNNPNFSTTVIETLGNKENKALYINTTLPCDINYWEKDENTGEWSYDFKIGNEFHQAFPHDEFDIEIFLNGDYTTSIAKKIFDKAEFLGTSENKIRVMGAYPEMDIPIILKVVKK